MAVIRQRQGPQAENKSSKTVDYRFYRKHRVPLVGSDELMTEDEFTSSTTILGSFGCGVFDSAEKDEKHYGRTLAEVFQRAALGEFQLIRFTTIERGGINERPRVYYDITWIEQRAVLSKDLLDHLRPSGDSRG